jgi:thiol-disulfide isomerase/thioredoxin
MRKLSLLLFIAILLTACQTETKEHKDYVVFAGKITNHLGSDGKLESRTYSKEIKIAPDGTFSDTLHLKAEDSFLSFTDGNEYTPVYLKNGYDIYLTLDTKEFDETVKYSGEGAENCNYLANKNLFSEKLFAINIYDMEEDAFNQALSGIISKLDSLLVNTKDLDSTLIAQEKATLSDMEKGIKSYYTQRKEENEFNAALLGKPSPLFVEYENIDGSKTSLKDLLGKYVYIDVWATWCSPCKVEIPYLKKLEEQYHEKNIQFVSISVDEEKNYEAWKTMVKEKELSGIQLYSDKNWKSDFVRAYNINGIPRFILIDPQGNIVSADALRPSNPKLVELLDSLEL